MDRDMDDWDADDPFAGTRFAGAFAALRGSLLDDRTPQETEESARSGYARIVAHHAAREHDRGCAGGIVATGAELFGELRLRQAEHDAAEARAEDARLLAQEMAEQG